MKPMLRATLLAAFLAVLTAPTTARAEGPYILPYERVTELWLTPSQARMYGPGAVNSLLGMEPGGAVGCQTPSVWCVADLTLYGVPADATFAFLSGILLITNPIGQSANFTITFRRPGWPGNCAKYIGQVVNANNPGGGERSGMALWVPIENGKVEYCFEYTGPIGWPDAAAYGVNLTVQGWAR